MRAWFSTNLILALFCSVCFMGCGGADTDNAKNTEATQSSEAGGKEGTKIVPKRTETAKELVVYSGRSAKLLDPIFKRFEAKTGVKLKVRNGKSDELANRLARARGQRLTATSLFYKNQVTLRCSEIRDFLRS